MTCQVTESVEPSAVGATGEAGPGQRNEETVSAAVAGGGGEVRTICLACLLSFVHLCACYFSFFNAFVVFSYSFYSFLHNFVIHNYFYFIIFNP